VGAPAAAYSLADTPIPLGGAIPAAPPAAPAAAASAAVPARRRPLRLARPARVRTFEALEGRSFRWFFLSMSAQFSSMHMQMVVTPYLVFELTGSYALLGAMSLASAVPGLLLGFAGGVIADRVSKKWLVQVGQALNALFTLALAALAATGHLRFEHLLLSSAAQGAVFAVMGPARHALIPEIVGPQRLTNAVALNMSGMNVTRMGVPALGGLLIAWVSPAGVYFVMAALLGLSMLWLAPVRRYEPTEDEAAASRAADPVTARSGRGVGAGMRDLVDGMRYIAREPAISALLAVNFFIVLMSMPYMQMMAGFVKEVLDAGPAQLGLLLSITGVGSLVGSLAIASMPGRGRGRVYLLSALVLGFALLVFSASTWFWVTAIVMVVIGVGQSGRMSLSNILIMAYARPSYQGRVMSVFMMEFSLVSFGTFLVGILASLFGVQLAIGGTAVALIAVALIGWRFVPRVRDLP